jgi:hypothetical protein
LGCMGHVAWIAAWALCGFAIGCKGSGWRKGALANRPDTVGRASSAHADRQVPVSQPAYKESTR